MNLSRGVKAGELTRIRRGVYAPSPEWSLLEPWNRYLARVHATLLADPDVILCLESAAALQGYPVIGDPGIVHVLGGANATSRLIEGVMTHSTADEREIVCIDAFAMTNGIDTAVDIARSRHNVLGLVVADAVLHRDPGVTPEMLVARNESRISSRGRRRARWVTHRASPAPESALESVDRAVIEWLGFPDPELQVWIGRDRVDKWWPDIRVAGEGDGDLKYDGRFGSTADALRERHIRDARLFAAGARAVPHWGWPEAIAADPLHAILTSAGVPVVNPRNHQQLHALRNAIRSRRP